MKSLPWRALITWLLAAFFLLGGTLNVFASPEILADYARWGYPAGFHLVAGLLEWLAALLILLRRTRFLGGLLGAAIMGAAALTVLLHGEFGHAVPPLIVMSLSLLTAMIWRADRLSTGFRPGG